MRNVIGYIFILAALLIAAAYYVGLTTDSQAATTGAVNIINSATGRKGNGTFADYPSQAA